MPSIKPTSISMQMKRHKIPASITIAQGLLESNAGASMLASVHNNHFGIKCHKSWQGNRAYQDDDEKGECFRSYDSPLDSYTDHSYFLQQPRYKPLFQLAIDDYKGWAKGLQKCGYATDKGYANKLIALVELYSLYELDREEIPSWTSGKVSSPAPSPEKKREKQTTSRAPQENSVQLLWSRVRIGREWRLLCNDSSRCKHGRRKPSLLQRCHHRLPPQKGRCDISTTQKQTWRKHSGSCSERGRIDAQHLSALRHSCRVSLQNQWFRHRELRTSRGRCTPALVKRQ